MNETPDSACLGSSAHKLRRELLSRPEQSLGAHCQLRIAFFLFLRNGGLGRTEPFTPMRNSLFARNPWAVKM